MFYHAHKTPVYNIGLPEFRFCSYCKHLQCSSHDDLFDYATSRCIFQQAVLGPTTYRLYARPYLQSHVE